MFFSSSKNSLKASIVDNALIVSSLSNGEPRALRVDMGKFMSSALEIKENEGKFSLVVKTGDMTAEEIEIFSNKKRAAEALQVIVDAMLRGNNPPPPEKTGGVFMALFKFVCFLLLMGVVFICVVFIASFIINRPLNTSNVVNAPSAITKEQTPPVPTGVPVPAEQALPEN
ncbi:MAG: hypothetical protein KAI76_02370 [Alphaproteobacteria bacterium]|nr:hypothetical protein [Alphaproteobacteria bacterium]